jgi:CheY-like chemotaxis protein
MPAGLCRSKNVKPSSLIFNDAISAGQNFGSWLETQSMMNRRASHEFRSRFFCWLKCLCQKGIFSEEGENKHRPERECDRMAARVNSNGLTVLIVEDFDDVRELLKLYLSSKGYEVVEAADGERAIKMAEHVRPDLILMDIGLPSLDGLSATCRIREISSLKGTPIVVISAHTDCRDVALQAGANDFLPKPLNFDLLDGLIEGMFASAAN